MLLKCFFESYDEYTLHSKLSPQQLKEMLDKYCVRSFFTQEAWQQTSSVYHQKPVAWADAPQDAQHGTYQQPVPQGMPAWQQPAQPTTAD